MGTNEHRTLMAMRVHAHLQVDAWTKSLKNLDDLLRIEEASIKAAAEKKESEVEEVKEEKKEKKTTGKKTTPPVDDGKPTPGLILPPPMKTEAPKKDGVTVDSVREKVIAVSNKLGKEKALEILSQYKAKKVAELKPEQLEVVNDVLDGLLNEEKKEDESSEVDF